MLHEVIAAWEIGKKHILTKKFFGRFLGKHIHSHTRTRVHTHTHTTHTQIYIFIIYIIYIYIYIYKYIYIYNKKHSVTTKF